MKTTKEQLAQMLDGLMYGADVPLELQNVATQNRLVIVAGYSDDLCEISGVIQAELSCYKGDEIVFTKDGDCSIVDEIGEYDDTERQIKLLTSKQKGNIVTANWCKGPYDWSYTTSIPHTTFEFRGEDNIKSQGIIFCIDNLK